MTFQLDPFLDLWFRSYLGYKTSQDQLSFVFHFDIESGSLWSNMSTMLLPFPNTVIYFHS